MTIHADDQVTADRWRESGRFVLFGEGEPCVHGLLSGCACGVDRAPPAAFVEAAKTCQNDGCDGGVWTGGRGPVDYDSCPNCSNGRPRHPVTVPCDHSSHSMGPSTNVPGEAMSDRWARASQPCTGRIPTDLLAVVEFGPVEIYTFQSWKALGQGNRPDTFILVVDGEAILVTPTEMTDLDLPPGIDPSTLPGQWAIGGSIEVAS